jgi:hypothetical protein
MSGFIFAIGSDEKTGDAFSAIKKAVLNGYFSTRINVFASNKNPFEGTLADYCSMKPGDNVYFFYKRKIYGIGELVAINGECKMENYPGSTDQKRSGLHYEDIKKELLFDAGKKNSFLYPWICFFKPAPSFFSLGIDMDDALTYKPSAFKSLRTFWKKSLIQIDDEENEALKEAILISCSGKQELPFSPETHLKFKQQLGSACRTIDPTIAAAYSQLQDVVKHEMAIEACVVDDLVRGKHTELEGAWDFVTHQLNASPFKPIDYMDRIDVFAYKYLPNTQAISEFLIIELKAESADDNTIDQVSKYVDWVCETYAYGNYNRIKALIIAHDFKVSSLQNFKKNAERTFVISSHPVHNEKWSNLHLISYSFEKKLKLKKIA